MNIYRQYCLYDYPIEMYLIEFPAEIWENEIIIKYIPINNSIVKHEDQIENPEWCQMIMDLETLNMLIQNFGMQSIYKIPEQRGNCDNGTLSREVRVRYCGAEIKMICGRIFVKPSTMVCQNSRH